MAPVKGGDTRSPVSVIVPFGGSNQELSGVLKALGALRLAPGDELVVVDNRLPGTAIRSPQPLGRGLRGRLVPAPEQRSSYYARNVGVTHSHNAWLLFLDGDCRPSPDLLGAYFEQPIPANCGAVGGEVTGLATQTSLLGRYAVARGLLRQAASLELGDRAYAATANLLVRRQAWEDVGGFCEDVRSAGDQDFCWRLKQEGWSLDYRLQAEVEHEHRESLRPFVRQWLKYGRGRAWLNRRFVGSSPPLWPWIYLPRTLVGVAVRLIRGDTESGAFRLIDGVAQLAESFGYLLSNRAQRPTQTAPYEAVVVDAFPSDAALVAARGDPTRIRIEARRRARRPEPWTFRGIDVIYAEDDGYLTRAAAAFRLMFFSRGRMPLPVELRANSLELAAMRLRLRRISNVVGASPSSPKPALAPQPR